MSLEKILIVEDEEDLRMLMRLGLKQLGYDVYAAENGVEGYQMAEKVIPRVIVTDVVMPVKNGNEMVKDLRHTTWGKNIPVIVLSAHFKMKDYFEIIGLEFLDKPFELNALNALIRKILDSPGGSAGTTVKVPPGGHAGQGAIEEVAVKDMALDCSPGENLSNMEGLARGEGAGRKIEEPKSRKLGVNPKRAYVIEPDSRVVKELHCILSFCNCEIVEIGSPSECLEKAKVNVPDLIIIKDVPGRIEAKELAYELKNHAGLRQVPIIIYQSLGEFIVEDGSQRFVLNTSGKELMQVVSRLSA